jgi:DNA-binding transcriptional regulator YdaS (Cro superfamily)
MHPIDKLMAMYTTPAKAGRAIGVSRQAVEQWVKKDFIPFKIAWMIEQKTGGSITRSQIWFDTDEKNSSQMEMKQIQVYGRSKNDKS